MNEIQELPLTLGIHSTYKGYHYLVTSLDLALEDENHLLFFTKNIFPLVAKKYHTSISCVERDLRTVILICWNSCCRNVLQDITPYPLEKPPTVGEFLDILYWQIYHIQETNKKDKI
ncbi:MAG: hypothetical protein EOM40_08865 [Clostridia bacterium]|nr:hypothetical protein [Clostridia bacterium]NCC44688.1 hypothetical protein [Clostridia bacterium]